MKIKLLHNQLKNILKRYSFFFFSFFFLFFFFFSFLFLLLFFLLLFFFSFFQRDYYKSYAEQLKVENSKKWRLQERDDWKALVESVQRDRSRLQDECNNLEHQLLLAREEIIKLKESIQENQNISHDNDRSYEAELRNKTTIIPINHPPTASVNETTSIENSNDADIPFHEDSTNNNNNSNTNNNNTNNNTINHQSQFQVQSSSLITSPSKLSNNNHSNTITTTTTTTIATTTVLTNIDENNINDQNENSSQSIDNTPELTNDGNTPDENLRNEIHSQLVVSDSPNSEILKSESVDSNFQNNNNNEMTSSALPPPLPPSSPSFPDNLPPVPQSPYMKYSTPQPSKQHKSFTPRSSITMNEPIITDNIQITNSLNQQVKDLTFELHKTKEEVSFLLILFF